VTAYEEVWNRQALAFARYFASRTVMMAVVALIGPMFSLLIVGVLMGVLYANNPVDYPDWANPIVAGVGIAGLAWFAIFLVLSISSLGKHFWYHGQILDPRLIVDAD
jgi:hypothetical protein